MSRVESSRIPSQLLAGKLATAGLQPSPKETAKRLLRSEFHKIQNGIPHRSDYKLTSDIDPHDGYDIVVLGKLLTTRCRLQLAILTIYETLVQNKLLPEQPRGYAGRKGISDVLYYQIDAWLLQHIQELKALSNEPGGDFTLPIVWLSRRINESPYPRRAVRFLREMLGIDSDPRSLDLEHSCAETEIAFGFVLGDKDMEIEEIKNSLQEWLKLLDRCDFVKKDLKSFSIDMSSRNPYGHRRNLMHLEDPTGNLLQGLLSSRSSGSSS